MNDFRNKTAVITGAASGIGLGMARTFAAEGMSVAMLDFRGDTLEDAAREVREGGGTVVAITVDVSDRAAVRAAAAQIVAAFGNVHVLCNNAGVVIAGKRVLDVTDDEWDWIIDTNLHGEINVLKAFVPGMLAHGEPAHVVNTASIGGFQVREGNLTGAYAVTKYALVALTEALAHDLAGTNVGVSVLAPNAVKSDIRNSSARLDPANVTKTKPATDLTPERTAGGMPPDLVGRRVLEAIRNGDLYIFTHLVSRAWLLERHAAIIAGYDATEKWTIAEDVLDMSYR
jgi:NAD(P)-dependent dehydrogenase (short-subunit alcohol dehydrogenase family)